MEALENRDHHVELEPISGEELAGIAGGVGPVFDVSKVEGPKLPSWFLPLNPRLLMTSTH